MSWQKFQRIRVKHLLRLKSKTPWPQRRPGVAMNMGTGFGPPPHINQGATRKRPPITLPKLKFLEK